MKNILYVTAVLATIAGVCPSLQAQSRAQCAAGTLASYESGGINSGCELGILIMSPFTFSAFGAPPATGAGAPTLLGDTQIEVTPTAVAMLGGNFTFSVVGGGLFSVGAGQSANYDIGYSFLIDPGPEMDDARLDLDPPSGNVTVDESFCNDSTFVFSQNSGGLTCSTSPASLPQIVTVTTTSPVGSITFNPPAFHSSDVMTTIALVGGTSGASFDAISGDLDIFNITAPEPATWALGFAGIFVVGLCRRFGPARS